VEKTRIFSTDTIIKRIVEKGCIFPFFCIIIIPQDFQKIFPTFSQPFDAAAPGAGQTKKI